MLLFTEQWSQVLIHFRYFPVADRARFVYLLYGGFRRLEKTNAMMLVS